MAVAETLVVAFQSLVDSSNNYDDDHNGDNDSLNSYNDNDDDSENEWMSLENRQGNLCEHLLSQLHNQQNQEQQGRRQQKLDDENNTDSVVEESIRNLFPNSKVSDLIPAVLNPLLNDRVDTQCLLPGTQDDTANEEVLSETTKAAFSLTLPGMQAGLLYAHLLSRPGALGSGLVDLEPLTALLALIRRWTMECCGRERSIFMSSSTTKSSSSTTTNKAASLPSPTKSPPQKRSRRDTTRTGSRRAASGDDEEEDDDEDERLNNNNASKVAGENQTRNILAMGSLVAAEVCKIPQRAEFASWSSESREVLLDAVLIAMGTAAALLAGKRNENDSPEKRILNQGQKALENCLVSFGMEGEEYQENHNPNRQQQHHETAVIILRGLMHLLQLKVILPNGERGKLEAYAVASEVLTSLMQKSNLAIAAAKTKAGFLSATKTPRRGKNRRSSVGGGGGGLTSSRKHNNQTPKSTIARRRRTSLDGGLTPMLSPALKKKGNYRNGGPLFDNNASKGNGNGKPRGIPAIFLGLLQKLTTGRAGLEKALLRKSTVQTIQSCMRWLPHSERTHFLEYLLKICHSKVSVHRLVACELLGVVLSQQWLEQHDNDTTSRDDYDDDDEDKSSYDTPEDKEGGKKNVSSLPTALWQALQGRLMDRIAAVRASAASSLETVMTEIQQDSKQSWHNLSFLNDDDGERLLMALRKRAIKDETATVRKAAILALTKVLLVKKESISEYYMHAICELCQDSSLLTRRAAAEALTTLLEACTSIKEYTNGFVLGGEQDFDVGLIVEAWSSCVLPMVLDEETAVKARSAFLQVVVLPIAENSDLDDGQKQDVAWRILANVGNLTGQHGASKGAAQALHTALSHLGRENSDLVHVELLQRAADMASQTLSQCDISETTVVGVWCLMEALLTINSSGMTKTLRSSKKDLSFCVSAWQIMLEKHSAQPKSLWRRSTLRSSLVVISKVASGIAPADCEDCEGKMRQKLLDFSFPPDSIGPALSAMTELTKHSGSRSSEPWIRSIFSESEKEISNYIQDANKYSAFSEQHQPKILRALFSIGEVSMVGFRLDDDEKTSPVPLYLKPSKALQELVQIMVSGHLPGASQTKIPNAIRAHAFIVLGKFCLRDESLARKSLILLARELHPSLPNPNQSVQSNALLVMGDLCVRYTNMTDRYLPVMASCLQNGTTDGAGSISILDRSSVVRKHAVLILSSLLLQDYLKWRGLLFHRFLVACSDEDEEVAVLAESVLSGPLRVRNPKIFFNHFVESMFVLNNCTAHPIYVSASRQGDGGSGIAVSFDGINLDGQEGEARRRSMYDFLLSKLSDEEKIGITARLAKEVLGEAVGNNGDLSQVCKGLSPPTDSSSPRLISAWNVLTDTFYVLTSKSIKVGRVQDDFDSTVEDPNQLANPSRQVTVAKTRLLSKISLKHMVEIVLPILCNLKVKLQGSCSPLLKDLMAYLLEIFGNHKVEVKEFLANDPTLLQEIEYDARTHLSNSA
jgi:condensin-2 complex subunit D3